MKYYLVAGEASGDLHASNLMKELVRLDPESNFRFFGGDLMSQVGGVRVKNYTEMAFMGFLEVAKNLKAIMGNLKLCKKDILEFQPDVVILVDFPGFNLRMAEFLHKKKIKVFYYISPQVWAWHKSRVHQIKKYVDRMFVILPFEKEFYKKWNYEVDFVGHPLLDAIAQQKKDLNFLQENNLTGKPIIAVLPGSRKQEIAKVLPVMLSIVDHFPDFQFVVAGIHAVEKSFYNQFEKHGVKFVFNQTYNLLSYAHAALVTSGTATLETALFEVPEIICYKGNPLSILLGKLLVKIPFISLVNLIAEKELVQELIQEDLSGKNLKVYLQRILSEKNYRYSIVEGYKEIKSKLGGNGASAKAAQLMIEYLKH